RSIGGGGGGVTRAVAPPANTTATTTRSCCGGLLLLLLLSARVLGLVVAALEGEPVPLFVGLLEAGVRAAFLAEFEAVLGEPVGKAAIPHAPYRSRPGELLGRFLWDVMICPWL